MQNIPLEKISFLRQEKHELVIKDKKIMNFCQSDPEWKHVGKGLNLFGLCTNSKCPAYNDEVTCKMGHRQFNIQDELQLLKCSECKELLEPHYDFGFFDCKFHLRGKRLIGKEGEKVRVELIEENLKVRKNKWVRFICQNLQIKKILVVDDTKSQKNSQQQGDFLQQRFPQLKIAETPQLRLPQLRLQQQQGYQAPQRLDQIRKKNISENDETPQLRLQQQQGYQKHNQRNIQIEESQKQNTQEKEESLQPKIPKQLMDQIQELTMKLTKARLDCFQAIQQKVQNDN